jgi:conjugative transfer pilus assembly protein TraH
MNAKLKSLFVRGVVALSCCAVALPAAVANINQEMSRFFSESALVTGTRPGAYKAQGLNVYAGGELQVRNPVRTYQLLSWSLPSIRAGCGGIDIYGGSFSHINARAFRDMLERVGDATEGLLFKAALAAINPLIESKIAELQAIIGKEGIFSRNSCQMANALVGGLSGMTGVNVQNSCQTMARMFYGEDDAAAADRCRGAQSVVNSDARNSGNRDLQALAKRDVNLMWEALRDTSYTRAEKEMFMNIAGTIILFNSPENTDPRTPLYIDPSIESLNIFMEGHQPSTASPWNVVIRNWWRCQSDECLAPTQGEMEILPFKRRIEEQLQNIATKLRNRERLDAADLSLINRTSIPVHRMLNVGYQAGLGTAEDIQGLYIEKFADVIALSYAHGFLSNALRNAKVYLAAAETMGPAEYEKTKEIRANIDRMLDSMEEEQRSLLQRKTDVERIVQTMERYERGLRQSLAGPQRTMLDFGALMSGKAGRG